MSKKVNWIYDTPAALIAHMREIAIEIGVDYLVCRLDELSELLVGNKSEIRALAIELVQTADYEEPCPTGFVIVNRDKLGALVLACGVKG